MKLKSTADRGTDPDYINTGCFIAFRFTVPFEKQVFPGIPGYSSVGNFRPIRPIPCDISDGNLGFNFCIGICCDCQNNFHIIYPSFRNWSLYIPAE